MTNMNTFLAKLPYYNRIMWGILVLFALVGVVVGKSDVAVPMACGIAVMWVMLKIISDALSAAVFLWALSLIKTEKPKDK